MTAVIWINFKPELGESTEEKQTKTKGKLLNNLKKNKTQTLVPKKENKKNKKSYLPFP